MLPSAGGYECGVCGSTSDTSTTLALPEEIPSLLFKMLPLSCIQIRRCKSCPNKNGDNATMESAFQPRPWSPVTSLSIEGDSSIRSALLFQVST